MGKTIKIDINGEPFETSEPFEAFAFTTAVHHYGYEGGLAQEITELCFELYLDFEHVNEYALVFAVLEHYDSLPDDYNEIKDFILDKGIEYNLF